jgi:hypothetical protein
LIFLRDSATHPLQLPELPAVNWNQVQAMIIPARQDSGWISGSAFPSDDLAGPNESGAQIPLYYRDDQARVRRSALQSP